MLSYVIAFSEVILFASHDQEFVSTVANRIIEITQGGGAIDRTMDFEDELERQGYLAEAV
jgi:ATPase subunit of ABC transporter with duplicated ATPase domains